MNLETLIGLLCAIYVVGYLAIYEINWKYIWKVIKKWISL
jgi:hypothetical protein